MKYSGINLTKEAKDLYTKSYKTLLKESKENTDMEGHICSWIRTLNIGKMSILLRAIYKFWAIY